MASIVHELGHLNRGDARWRLLAQLATAFQVFHPLSHGLLRQLVIGQELSADRWAAETIGHTRFVRGISQLALRLDHAALPRRAQGIGMSHSSSFLIRRIKMLRNGMPALIGKRNLVMTKAAALLVVTVAVVSASWSLSAEEPVRVAARIESKAPDQRAGRHAKPWDVLPGRSGYWQLNIDSALKHPVIGQSLNQAESVLLASGWLMVAKEEAKGRRVELGLSLTNVESIAGSVNMKTELLPDAKTDHNFNTSVTAHEFVMRMRRDADWLMVAAALPEERVDAAFRGLVGPEFPEKSAQQLIDGDFFAGIFAQQTDPRQFIVRQEPDKENEDSKPPVTAPAISALWNDHGGELATMIVRLPSMPGDTDTRLQKLAQALHEASEYYVVGVDLSEEPDKIKLRLGLTPRGETTATELSKLMSATLQAAIEEAKEDAASRDDGDETAASVLQLLEHAEPEIRNSSDPSLPSAVIIEIDVMPDAVWFAFTG
jgi:hypothetical protein